MAKDDNIGVDNQNEKKSSNDEEKEKQADDSETKETIHEQIDEVINSLTTLYWAAYCSF